MLEILGLGLIGAAALGYAWSVGSFTFEGLGTPLPFAPPREFVVRGPYRHTRHTDYCRHVPRWLPRLARVSP